MRLAGYALLGLVALLAAGCSQRDAETEHALEQKVSADEVKTAQEQLTKLNEYQGEVNGKLDSVTVNAIEAFQRDKGLKADGILTAETKRLLQESAGTGAAS